MENIFSKLNEKINEYNKFIIMGHKNPDLDSIGSCFGLYEIFKTLNKQSYVFLDINNIKEYNSTVVSSIETIKGKINFLSKKDYKDVIDDKTLLIVVDVNQIDRLECPEILNTKIDTVVLDHHMRSHNYIKDSIISYIDTNLSSITELIAFYAESLNIDLHTVISTIMLAGIEIDTNSYNLRTTENTYKASAILMSFGADTILKQELLKETMEDYIKRADIIKTSFMINENIAMCLFSNKCKKERLAEVADEMLKFVDVEASFAIGKLDSKTVGVSARSLGKIDVEHIMKKMNGGGSSTNAATQLENSTIKEVKQKIIDLVR